MPRNPVTTAAPIGTTMTANRDRFLRLAPARVQRILDALDTLGNCSVPSQYDYSPTEVDKIEAALNKAVVDTIRKFRGDRGPAGFSF